MGSLTLLVRLVKTSRENPMRRNIHPAEELHEIRAKIRALKTREAALRAFLLSRQAATICAGARTW
jgi:hypothetical protein